MNCVDYPNMFYETYADCDDDFVRRSLPVNLKPFWSVSNISSATNIYKPPLNTSFPMLLNKISMGYQYLSRTVKKRGPRK